MAITPSGSPAWLRTVAIADYGGHVSKENYLSRGAIDALTDIDAEQISRMQADLAAAVRVAPFCVLAFTCDDTTPGPPTVTWCAMMTGVRTTSYVANAPPSGFPSATRLSNGQVRFTFASSYSDDYGVAGAFTPTTAEGTLKGTTSGLAKTQISGQTVDVILEDNAAAAVSNGSAYLVVG